MISLYSFLKKCYQSPMKNKKIPLTSNSTMNVKSVSVCLKLFLRGKNKDIIQSLLLEFNESTGKSILFTRLAPEIFYGFPETIQKNINYHELSRTAFAFALPPHKASKKVAVVSAGSADAKTAWEAARTLEYLGIEHSMFEDCGVAGLWRIQKALPQIREYDIVIAVAGLDAALVSVLGGLIKSPILAVPTSVGYGMAKTEKRPCPPCLPAVLPEFPFSISTTVSEPPARPHVF